jgi:hypothetical protein
LARTSGTRGDLSSRPSCSPPKRRGSPGRRSSRASWGTLPRRHSHGRHPQAGREPALSRGDRGLRGAVRVLPAFPEKSSQDGDRAFLPGGGRAGSSRRIASALTGPIPATRARVYLCDSEAFEGCPAHALVYSAFVDTGVRDVSVHHGIMGFERSSGVLSSRPYASTRTCQRSCRRPAARKTSKPRCPRSGACSGEV